jgi:anti-sigma B factor antagonist
VTAVPGPSAPIPDGDPLLPSDGHVTHRVAPDPVRIVPMEAGGAEEGAVALRVSGELDALSATLLSRHLDGLDLAPDQVVLLDLAAVSFIDSSGLRELVAPTRGVIRVIAASDVVRRILEITGLEEMMSPPPS